MNFDWQPRVRHNQIGVPPLHFEFKYNEIIKFLLAYILLGVVRNKTLGGTMDWM